MLTGKKEKMTQQEKDEKRLELDGVRNFAEAQIKTGFELLYPLMNIPEN